jgi:hypothetical protein
MTRFTELPDEILLQIVSYHLPPPLSIASKPFAYWPAYISQHQTLTLQQTKHIKALAHSNRHFYDVLYPIIHQNLFLRVVQNCDAFCESITTNDRLGYIITTAHLSKPSAQDIAFMFFLPNIRCVHLDDWSDWEMFDQEGDLMNGASPITSLYLSNCGAFEAPLKQVLSWLKALKELWYEASQVEWEGHLEGEAAPGFRCSAISRALQPLAGSLEKLVFTRTDPNHEGLFYTDAIDLRNFGKLKELEIFHVLLVGYDSEHDIWTNLPASLESLSVWYDDAGYTNFLVDGNNGNRPDWLFGVLQRKRGHFPKLEKVRVVSIEWWDEEQADEWLGGEGGEGMEKSMPTELKRTFVDASVSYSIHLQETEKCWKEVVEGGASFDDDWDEKVISNPNRS